MAPEDLEEQIEAAEEAADTTQLLTILATCTSHGGNDDWEAATESALDALYRLVKGGTAVGAGDALEKIFQTLEAWKEQEAIVEVAFGCVVALTSKDDGQQKTESIHLALLVELMQSFADESTIQEQACLAVEGLAKSSAAIKEKLVALEEIKAELAAAKGRISNERNKAYPDRAATALGITI